MKKTLTEIAREHNIEPYNLIGRVNKGWDLEEAIKVPYRKNKKHNLPGFTPPNIKAAAARGISKHTFYTRLLRGWPLDQAIEIKPVKRR